MPADVLIGYGITATVLGVLTWRTIRRERALRSLIAEDDASGTAP